MTRIVRVPFLIGCCCLLMPFGAPGQGAVPGTRPATETGMGGSLSRLVGFFAPFFLPKLINDNTQLRAYISSEELASVRIERGEVRAVDAIFAHAMHLSWGNTYEALLISFSSVLEHRRFGVRLPLVGPLLWVPLTSEFEEEFERRVRALPRRLYADTPEGGDRDKLQHFFGSAFLAYAFESGDVAERVGRFIEWGEDKFIVDGALDDRDFRANRQGQEFGLRLREDASAIPSDFMKLSMVARDLETPAGAAPPVRSDSTAIRMEMR